MSGWLVARNRPPLAAYAAPGPRGNSVVAGASVRLDLIDATSKEGSAGACASGKLFRAMSTRAATLTPVVTTELTLT